MFILVAQPSCTIQEDINYGGSDLNSGIDDQEILYLGSCQSFCKSKYPASTHYTFVTTGTTWTDGHNTCWCKSSNAGAGASAGMIAGDLSCPGNRKQSVQSSVRTLLSGFGNGWLKYCEAPFTGVFWSGVFWRIFGHFFRVTKRLPTAVLTLGVFLSVFRYILTTL